jgi:hypothetical protein
VLAARLRAAESIGQPWKVMISWPLSSDDQSSRHADAIQMAEVASPRNLFTDILRMIENCGHGPLHRLRKALV